jgi:hypothetical protein
VEPLQPYVIACSEKLEKLLKVTKCTKESQLLEVLRTTRTLMRLNIQDEELNSKMDNFKFGDNKSQILKWKRQQFMDFQHFGTSSLVIKRDNCESCFGNI